jgi:hypothetical protein
MTPKTGPNDASGVVWARYASFFPRFLKTKFMYLGIQPIFHPPPHLPLPRSKREPEGPFSFCFRPPPQPCPSLAPNGPFSSFFHPPPHLPLPCSKRESEGPFSSCFRPPPHPCPSLAPNASWRGPNDVIRRLGNKFFFLFLFFYY